VKVDIIMPVFNQLKYTKICLESLYKTTDLENFNILVIDNGSSDGTGEFLLEFGRGRPNLRMISNSENLGWCKALNQGHKHLSSDSDFVLWANNDIVFEKDWLPKMIAHFKPGVGAVGPTSNYVTGRQKIYYNLPGEYEEEVSSLIGFFLMIRRDVVDMVGEVDERFGIGGSEEWDYAIRMRKDFGYKCVIARDVYIHHFGSQTLMPYLGNDLGKYNEYYRATNKLLEEKLGKEIVDKWLFSDLKIDRERTGWPQGLKLGWALPLTWPYINSNTHLSLMALERPDFIYLDAPRGGGLDSKREAQIEYGLEQGCTHFFLLDADMVYPAQILKDLFNLLDEGADLAGGLCWRGYPPWEPVVWHKHDRRTLLPFKDFKLGDVIDAGATGAACLLVKREVFEKLEKPWFKFFKQETVKEDGSIEVQTQGEDNYFTRKATEAGFKLNILTAYDVGHIREFEIDRNFWLTMTVMGRVVGENKEWGNVIALLKKLDDKEWFSREVLNSISPVSWPLLQKQYEVGLLHNFLFGKKVKNVVEVGTKNGGTALLWAELVNPRDGVVYCVDREFDEAGLVYKDHPLKKRIVQVEGDSHSPETLRRLKDSINGTGVDFLFIDGDHSYEGVKMDFEDYGPLVKDGGFIAFHDIVDSEWQRSQNCGVIDFWKEIKGKYNHFEIIDPSDKAWMGIGILEWKRS